MPPQNMGMGMGFQQPLGGPNMGMDVGLGLERVFPCVRLRGLPFDVTEDEIRIFLVSGDCNRCDLGGDPHSVLHALNSHARWIVCI